MKRLKKLILFSIFLAGITLSGFSLDEKQLQFLKNQGFTKEDLQGITEIYIEAQKIIQMEQAEVQISRAQINKILLNSNPVRKEIEKILKTALECELKIRMAEIDKQLKSRKLLGDRKWATLVKAVKIWEEQKKWQTSNILPGKNTERPQQWNQNKEKRLRELYRELEELLGHRTPQQPRSR